MVTPGCLRPGQFAQAAVDGKPCYCGQRSQFGHSGQIGCFLAHRRDTRPRRVLKWAGSLREWGRSRGCAEGSGGPRGVE